MAHEPSSYDKVGKLQSGEFRQELESQKELKNRTID